MSVICIVQARMGSTRLPGKILLKIKDKPILSYVIERLKLCKELNNIIISTTKSNRDDVVEKYCIKNKIDFFRGSENDVLSRYYYSSLEFKADIIVRVTSDCPLIDPIITDNIILNHMNNKADYTSNTIIRSFPRGFDVEVFNFNILKKAFINADKMYQREHVTPYIKENPEIFNLKNIKAKGLLNRPDIRITLDTKEDYILINKIISYFDKIDFTAEEIINYLIKHKELLEINKNVKQKELNKT
jgi:spore coat polysaccharide biosynthesis protein SpsF